MAEIENIEEINENFDTIKTLLNSIRAQGVLNTSDVDKLLTGINSKLEKINTDEDIDLLKINLSDLGKSLEERHSTILSKFGAIESLFSSLLQNSSEMLKSSEIKELFDIIATNLSVFSREVVSQKESLTDISLRIESMRSDDSQKKEIIKSISSLKPDIDKLSNGFDSIIVNINEGFKSIVNSLSTLDNSDILNKVSASISDIDISSKAVLSAIQMMDQKTDSFEDVLKRIYTKDDAGITDKKLAEISIQGRETASVLSELNDRYGRIDMLAEKIDASVGVIANLKAVLAEIGDQKAGILLERLNKLEEITNEINNDTKLAEFKKAFEEISLSTLNLLDDLSKDNKGIKELFVKLSEQVKNIDVNALTAYIQSVSDKTSSNLQNNIENVLQKYNSTNEIAITKVMDDITSGTGQLESKIQNLGDEISTIYKNGISSVVKDIASVRTSIAQIDEANVSANNAIFSNISDRLAAFEDNLSNSLKNQEDSVKAATNSVNTNFEALKEISGVLDYKLDASVVEASGLKELVETIKQSIDGVIALNFAERIKDLRGDLYSSKQDLVNVIDLNKKTVSDDFAKSLAEKYETGIDKLNKLEESIKQAQISSLAGINTLLENISSSIVDLLSYVSEIKNSNNEDIDAKLDKVHESVKEVNINYVESVRDLIDGIKDAVIMRIDILASNNSTLVNDINTHTDAAALEIKHDLNYTFSKLTEIQKLYDELSKQAELRHASSNEHYTEVISAADEIKNAYITKIDLVREAIAEKMLEFKQEYKCDNADSINEIKTFAETINSKNLKDLSDKITTIRTLLLEISSADKEDRISVAEKLQEAIKNLSEEINNNDSLLKEDFLTNINVLYKGLENVQAVLTKVDENVDSDMSQQLSLIETSFDTLTNRINTTLIETDKNFSTKINERLSEIAKNLGFLLDKKIDNYNEDVSATLSLLKEDITEQTISLKDSVLSGVDRLVNDVIETNIPTYINNLSEELIKVKNIISENDDKSAVNYDALRQEILSLSNDINIIHDSFEENLKNKLASIRTGLLSDNTFAGFETSITEKFGTLTSSVNTVGNSTESIKEVVDSIYTILTTDKDILESINQTVVETVNSEITHLGKSIEQETTAIISGISEQFDILKQSHNDDINTLKNKVEQIFSLADKNSTDIKAYLNEQFAEIKYNNNTDALKLYIENALETLKEPLLGVLNTSIFKEVFNNFEKNNTLLVNSALEKALSEIKLLNNSFSELSNSLINEISINEDFASSEIKQEFETFKTEFESIAKTIENSSANTNSDIKSVCEQTNGTVQELSSLLNKLEKDISNSNENSELNIDTSKKEIQKNILTISAEISSIETTLDNLLTGYQTIANDIQANVAGIEAKLDDTLTGYQTVANDIQANVAGIEAKLDDTLTGYQTVANDIQANVAGIEAKLDDTLTGYQTVANDIQANVAGIEAKLDDTLTGYQTVANDIQANVAGIETKLEDSLADYQAIAGDVQVNIAGIEAKLDNSSIEYKNIVKKAFNDTVGEVQAIQDRIDDLDSILKDFAGNSDENSLKMAIEDAHGDIRVVQNLLENFEQKIEAQLNNNLKDTADSDVIKDDLSNIINEINSFEVLMNESFEKNDTFINNLNDTARSDIKRLKESINNTSEQLRNDIAQTEGLIKEIVENTSQTVQQVADSVESIKIQLVEQLKEEKNNSETINYNINNLQESVDELKSQLLKKIDSTSEQVSVESHINEIKHLIDEQFGYVQDISEMCTENLLDIPNMGINIEKKISESIQLFSEKIDGIHPENGDLEPLFKSFKSDIITQFINIFNQISFAAEQEEILDFIDEKHNQLIDVLSHIVTTTESAENKIASIKEELGIINKKVTQILSSEEDEVDYVYSLQDLESDIANLRIVLNEMKNTTSSEELNELINSTSEIYKLVDLIKKEIPTKKDIEDIAEDIVSISTRTNKLILASDESYKTLQDNLGEFKLVIDDLDERTRNFAHDSGMDKIDLKLNTLNDMMVSGARTNQVFNQVFEYLAEWVDKAGIQINAISDKVETLDDIGQIKSMLADLKEKAEDDSESVELIEALSTVFDKQTKKIASIESKIDKMLVQATIDNKKAEKANKIDMSPMENTLNSFLVAIDERFAKQEEKISLLESKLETIVASYDKKDTDKFTKKLTGLDKQIAKLSKNIENIVSDVVKK